MAELFVNGSIVGASGFPSSELCCKWSILAGEGWTLVEGDSHGQTHVDIPHDPKYTVWNHPIDVHFTTNTMQNWPKVQFQVFHQDMFGRNELYGYGFVHVPMSPGSHRVDCVTWRPVGSFMDSMWSFFLGATPHLRNLDIIHTPTDRFRLSTETMGKVYLDLNVIVRNFDKHGVAFLPPKVAKVTS
ncbi:b9 domain-containing protein 2-like protein [Cladochytrium replicatum]|nr:b9 domain-containing protein 2-like protein [Cladochytrium replicatum]